jgi:hypothetical protein
MELLQGKQEQHKFSEIKLFFLLFFKIDPQEETTRHHDTRVVSGNSCGSLYNTLKEY